MAVVAELTKDVIQQDHDAISQAGRGVILLKRWC